MGPIRCKVDSEVERVLVKLLATYKSTIIIYLQNHLYVILTLMSVQETMYKRCDEIPMFKVGSGCVSNGM
jgi:hypothetical protein